MVMFRNQVEQKPHFAFLNNRKSPCPLGGGVHTMQSETTEESTSPCSLVGATYILTELSGRKDTSLCLYI